MSVPLDRLYHFIDNIACHSYDGRVIIYRFWPHGSKNIDQLCELYGPESYFAYLVQPMVYCHDQEPLDYDRLSKQQKKDFTDDLPKKLQEIVLDLNLAKSTFNINYKKNLFGKSLLLHSERRSKNLEKYLQPSTNQQSQLLSVYYWSHALIARDWFRYAQHEVFKKNSKKKFLIYNRAWTGTREYRLKFTDLLITHQLVDQCLTHCNPVDSDTDIHYSDYNFHNPVWQPEHVLEHHVPSTTALSTASADFDSEDYNCTEIEVVLETLFDDDRLHLTEKSLRPIACGQPFILVATHGSLQYLKEYGFKTFDSVWDESYDRIEDPNDRMLAIIQLMKTINAWSLEEKFSKMQQIEQIVLYNQTHFFSENFFNFVVDELKQNFDCAFDTLKKYPDFEKELARFAELQKMPELQHYWSTTNLPKIMQHFVDNFHKK